jgi:hypothetical protein
MELIDAGQRNSKVALKLVAISVRLVFLSFPNVAPKIGATENHPQSHPEAQVVRLSMRHPAAS